MQYQSGAVSPVESVQKGWDLIKNDYWVFFGMTAITLVILFMAAGILGFINNLITGLIAGGMGMATTNTGDIGRTSAMFVPQLIGQVIGIFVSIIVGTLSGCLYCGIYAALSRKANTGVADFGDLFNGFQKFLQCLIVAVIVSIVQFIFGVVILIISVFAFGVSAIGAGTLMGKDGMPDLALLSGIFAAVAVISLISVVFYLIYGALTTFIYPLIGERNLSGVEAVTTSVKSGFANIGGLILLLFLLGLMAFGGLMVCFVGILFVMPVIVAAVFTAYRSVFGATGNQYNYSPPPPPNFGNQPGY